MLTGKIALVSGGTGYLGTEICRTLAAYGARVIFSYCQNQAKATHLEAELTGSRAISLDFRNVQHLTSTIEALYRDIPRIDILVNNAAISQMLPFAMLEEEDADLAIAVNIKGTLFLTKAVMRGMIRHKTGAIISLGSIAGERVLAVPIMYAMTKAAISGFTRALAPELKKFGIRVNTVVPGMLDGGVARDVPDGMKSDFLKHNTTGRAGTAKEVAEVIAFLASDNASYINGQSIHVNGGI